MMRSRRHINQSLEIQKVGLCCYDNKRYLLDDGITSYSYGPYKQLQEGVRFCRLSRAALDMAINRAPGLRPGAPCEPGRGAVRARWIWPSGLHGRPAGQHLAWHGSAAVWRPAGGSPPAGTARCCASLAVLVSPASTVAVELSASGRVSVGC